MLSLKDGKIVREWSILLPECQAEAPGLIATIQKKLAAYEVQGLSSNEESASTGFFKSVMGKRRDFLVVRVEQFSEWLVCIGARDYGRTLNVVWYLVTSPKFLNKIRSAAAGDVLVDELDVFDQQDVNAFASLTRMVTVSSTEEIAQKKDLNLDRLDKQARGIRAAG